MNSTVGGLSGALSPRFWARVLAAITATARIKVTMRIQLVLTAASPDRAMITSR